MVKYNTNLTKAQKKQIDNIITRVPINEMELVRYFIKLEEILGFTDVKLYNEYPDASAFLNGVEIDIEFEKESLNFRNHKHDENLCSMIICWENNRDDFRIPVLELATLSKNWIDAKNQAFREYWSILRTNKILEYKKLTEEEINHLQYLKDKFNFNHDDAVLKWTGLSKSGLRPYKNYAPKYPECIGGTLTCIKKDIDVEHIENVPDYQKLIPVVLCSECKNKELCELGKRVETGYYFIMELSDLTPMKTKFCRKEIKNPKLLNFLKNSEFNIWESVRFKRR